MRKFQRLFAALLWSLLLLAAGFWLGQSNDGRVHAAQANIEPSCTVPESYGTYRGEGPSGMIFEDSQGNLRVVGMGGNCWVTFWVARR
jgi:hypothetical protein